jgi:hypothetical protein
MLARLTKERKTSRGTEKRLRATGFTVRRVSEALMVGMYGQHQNLEIMTRAQNREMPRWEKNSSGRFSKANKMHRKNAAMKRLAVAALN